jgi:hypothetical protein
MPSVCPAWLVAAMTNARFLTSHPMGLAVRLPGKPVREWVQAEGEGRGMTGMTYFTAFHNK